MFGYNLNTLLSTRHIINKDHSATLSISYFEKKKKGIDTCINKSVGSTTETNVALNPCCFNINKNL